MLSQVAGLEQTIHRRHANLQGHSDFVPSSVVTALHFNKPDLALEWLEQGRCLVWNQLNQLRAPIDDLHTKSPSLANHFIKVASALESHGTRSILSIPSSHRTLAEDIRLQDDTQNHTNHAAEYTQLLKQIRSLPGFEDFLQPPKATDLLSSLPSNGPVIIFNVHNIQCDALALIAGIEEPLHIPLKDFSLAQAEELQKTLRFDLLKQRDVEDHDRMPQRVRLNPSSMPFVLKELWCKIVQPIFEALGYFVRCYLSFIYRNILIFCTLISRCLRILQIAPAYGGARLVHSHFFHSTQLGYTVQRTCQDHVCPILWFHRTHQLSVPLTTNSPHHPHCPDVPSSSLSANQTRQVLIQYLQPEKRHLHSKPR